MKFELETRTILVIIVLSLLAIAAFSWIKDQEVAEANDARERAEFEAGLRASEILSAKFEEAPALRVATLSGEVRAIGGCKSMKLFTNQQRTIAPYVTNYFVDLKKVSRASYRWDSNSRTMFVELPEPVVEPPSIDMARARSEQSGTFISRACGLTMQRQVAGRLKAKADQKANQPEYLERARDISRRILTGLTRAPLAAAGLREVKIIVRFPSDSVPQNDERWDMSRSLVEVLSETR